MAVQKLKSSSKKSKSTLPSAPLNHNPHNGRPKIEVGVQEKDKPSHRTAAGDQVHDRRPLRGSFFGAFTAFSHRRLSRSSQPSRSVTSWRNCEFSSSSSAILSRSLSFRSAIFAFQFPLRPQICWRYAETREAPMRAFAKSWRRE
jgi:hypothetical protein